MTKKIFDLGLLSRLVWKSYNVLGHIYAFFPKTLWEMLLYDSQKKASCRKSLIVYCFVAKTASADLLSEGHIYAEI